MASSRAAAALALAALLSFALSGCPDAKRASGTSSSTEAGTSSDAAARGPVRYVDVCAGYTHSCGVTDAGSVRCWGTGKEGELGAPGVVRSSVPVNVPGVSDVVQVRCGAGLTCARGKSVEVTCWGDDGRMSTSGVARVDALRGANDLHVSR